MKTFLPGEPWFHPDMACLEVPPDTFFATDTEGIAEAKAVCRTCPMMQMCAQRALAYGEDYGVWGGLSAEERRKLLKEQQRAQSRRPRRRTTAGTSRVGSAA